MLDSPWEGLRSPGCQDYRQTTRQTTRENGLRDTNFKVPCPSEDRQKDISLPGIPFQKIFGPVAREKKKPATDFDWLEWFDSIGHQGISGPARFGILRCILFAASKRPSQVIRLKNWQAVPSFRAPVKNKKPLPTLLGANVAISHITIWPDNCLTKALPKRGWIGLGRDTRVLVGPEYRLDLFFSIFFKKTYYHSTCPNHCPGHQVNNRVETLIPGPTLFLCNPVFCRAIQKSGSQGNHDAWLGIPMVERF